MEIFKTKTALTDRISELKNHGRSIGFVPTMGALHEGHLTLIRKSKEENDITVVSIFVNPVQFNNPDDLKKYPRILDKDIVLLEKENVEILYTPDEKDIYPEGVENINERYDFGHLDKILEGKFRPGHFNGVAIVVKRLFEAVKPHKAYFGKKDYQQLLIVKQLVKMLNLPLEIVPVEIVREKNGLAMSSRNLLLDEKGKEKAAYIYRTLLFGKNLNASVEATKRKVMEYMRQHGLNDIEYFEIADKETLLPAPDNAPAKGYIALTAVNCCGVRLIDNMEY